MKILLSLTGKLLTENDQYEMDMGTQDQQNINVDRLLLDYMNEEVVRKWFNLRKNFSSRTTSWIESL